MLPSVILQVIVWIWGAPLPFEFYISVQQSSFWAHFLFLKCYFFNFSLQNSFSNFSLFSFTIITFAHTHTHTPSFWQRTWDPTPHLSPSLVSWSTWLYWSWAPLYSASSCWGILTSSSVHLKADSELHLLTHQTLRWTLDWRSGSHEDVSVCLN